MHQIFLVKDIMKFYVSLFRVCNLFILKTKISMLVEYYPACCLLHLYLYIYEYWTNNKTKYFMNAQVDFNVPHVFLCVTACLRRSFHMIHIPATLTKNFIVCIGQEFIRPFLPGSRMFRMNSLITVNVDWINFLILYTVLGEFSNNTEHCLQLNLQ